MVPSTEKTCANCKRWARWDNPDGTGVCKLSQKVKPHQKVPRRPPPMLVYVVWKGDAEITTTTLVTREDHCCKEHVPLQGRVPKNPKARPTRFDRVIL